jgi:predicted alpha/beta superfamily hydrolase/DNA-nicking Smr family endonuclease
MGSARTYGRHTLTGAVRYHRLSGSLYSRHPRTIAIYLPPGYDNDRSLSYPVLYMQDGQNIFDEATAFAGVEWSMDETAERLIRSGRIEPLIIVGVYNTPDRLTEYTQVADPSMGGGGGADTYARFLIDELKPLIDSTYRTRPEAAHTAVGGSSLGGLVSFYLGMAYPQTFARMAVVSPAVWWASAEIFNWVRPPRATHSRIWLDMGTTEGRTAGANERLLKGARSLRDTLVNCGWILGRDLRYLEAEGAQHNEAAWASRVEPMLAFLFDAAPDAQRTADAQAIASAQLAARPAARSRPDAIRMASAPRDPTADRRGAPNPEAAPASFDEPVALPIDGTLDLHTFAPRDLGQLVPDYIDACRRLGITRIRIIHGKGTGALRRSVHALLERTPAVASFRLASDDASGWGATIVTLHAP